MRGVVVIRLLVVAGLVAGLAGCASEEVPYSNGELCRAVVAATSGRDLALMRVQSESGKVADVAYQYGGREWRWRCAIEWPVATLASWQDDGALGRWRDTPQDSRIELSWGRAGVRVLERWPDGSERKAVMRVNARSGD